MTASSGRILIATVTIDRPPAARTPDGVDDRQQHDAADRDRNNRVRTAKSRVDERQRRCRRNRDRGLCDPIGNPERPRGQEANRGPKLSLDIGLNSVAAKSGDLGEPKYDA